MAVVSVNTTGAFSAEVRQLVQALRIARSAAHNIQQVNGNMSSGQLEEIMGIDSTVIPEGPWVANVDALVTLLDNQTIKNFTGNLV
jgi:hypothetical protein